MFTAVLPPVLGSVWFAVLCHGLYEWEIPVCPKYPKNSE